MLSYVVWTSIVLQLLFPSRYIDVGRFTAECYIVNYFEPMSDHDAVYFRAGRFVACLLWLIILAFSLLGLVILFDAGYYDIDLFVGECFKLVIYAQVILWQIILESVVFCGSFWHRRFLHVFFAPVPLAPVGFAAVLAAIILAQAALTPTVRITFSSVVLVQIILTSVD